MKYDKPPTTIDQQIAILKQRKLVIDDNVRAAKYLNSIGYYRLTGYMYHLQEGKEHFFNGKVTFNDIIDTYNFDKKLRYLIGSYIERIEVAMRSLLTNTFSLTQGFYWYADSQHYTRIEIPEHIKKESAEGKPLPRKYNDTHEYIYKSIKENFNNSSERFIANFKRVYTSEPIPPSNMAMEIISMGKISKLYEALKNSPEKKQVADTFNLPHTILSSWLIYLTNIRNICAHHSRLWNRKTTADRFAIPQKKSLSFNGKQEDDFNTSMYGTVSVMLRLLNAINPENSFEAKLKGLLNEYPKINPSDMGFPVGWENKPAWKPI